MNQFTLCAFADEAGSSIQEQIDALHTNGIPLLEIRGVEGRNVTQWSVKEAQELAKRLEQEEIQVWSIGSPCGKIGIRDPFEPHLDQFRHTLELAHAFGAHCLRMFSFFLNDVAPEDCRDEVMERLQRMIEAAKDSDIILCHENEKGIYGDIAARCEDIHRTFPSLKAVYDPANFLQCGQETIAAFQQLSPYIYYCHIKDCRADGGIVPAGKGEGRIPELIRLYAELGGEVLTLEPHLAVFSGLNELENGQKSEVEDCYPTQRAAFDAAAQALKECL